MCKTYSELSLSNSDFDDTAANLLLGAMLKAQSNAFPSAWDAWQSANTDIQGLCDLYKEFAYMPYSPIPDQNTIDTRTYYFLHEFLDTYDSTDVRLISTWVQNFTTAAALRPKGMPFNVNNVDVSVGANNIFAISSALLSGLFAPTEAWFDDDLQHIFG